MEKENGGRREDQKVSVPIVSPFKRVFHMFTP